MNVVIMAGGGGTRLWPLSRIKLPKQFIDLGSGKTLIEHTYERALAVAREDEIFVATTNEHAQKVRQLLPKIAAAQVFLETEKRDTAPAFAAAAVQLIAMGRGEEPTIFMWSDHVFTAEKEFIKGLKKIPRLVKENPETVIIMGHYPTFAETDLGYFEAGKLKAGERNVYEVKTFKEKPDKKTAEKYVLAGNYFWNMAYVSVVPTYLLSQLKEHEPKLMAGIEKFAKAIARKDKKASARAYAALPKMAIDYALLERTPRILAVIGDYGWSDVGGWAAMKDVFGIDGDYQPKAHHVHVDARNNYVYNTTGRVVSLVGMKNVIVVVTDDAILVTDKDAAHKVKEVVQRLGKEKQDKWL